MTSSQPKESVISYIFLNFQNRDNTLLNNLRLSSDNVKKILHVCEHKCDRPPDHIQYEHKGLWTEQLALNQIRDLIRCVYYTKWMLSKLYVYTM